MKGAGTDEDTLIRIIVCRSEVRPPGERLTCADARLTLSHLSSVRPGDGQGDVPGEVRRVPEGRAEGRVQRRLQAPPGGDLPLKVGGGAVGHTLTRLYVHVLTFSSQTRHIFSAF